MKKLLIVSLFFPIFLFSGIFEHFLNQDKSYILEHHFTCTDGMCQTKEKNIYDDEIMDDSIIIIRTYLDQTDKVFKIEIDLSLQDERKNAFYDAIVESSQSNSNTSYVLDTINDKYGNHTKVIITDEVRKNGYIKYYKDQYFKAMTKYKENQQK